MKNSRRNIIIGVVVVVIIGILFLLFRPQSAPVANYIIEDVTQGSIEVSVSASGRAVATKSQNMTARTSARVVNVLVSTGDEVTEGTVLVQLDNTDLQSAYKNAQYAFNSAVYRREQAKNAMVYDDNAVKQAQQAVNQAQLGVETAKRNLENDKIVAPFSGQITAVNVKVGDTASLASPAVTIQTVNQVEGILNINEIDVTKVALGQELNAEIDAISGIRSAKIYSIVNTAETINGVVTYLGKIRFNDATNIRPGMSLNAEIIVSKKDNVILVPAGALIQSNGITKVKVFKGKNAQNVDIIEEREIKIGLNNNSVAEVIEGLQNGDKVVITLDEDSGSGGLFN